MKVVFNIVFILLVLPVTIVFGQSYTVESYIEQWKDVAIRQMQTHKIPASITLAQGILESGYGNSELATKANNHFGIKCHNWTGPSVKKDDDKKNECFRKYQSAEQSFQDHSEFLTTRSRYASLFELEITDYKAWAKGLRQAGYATNPKYPKLLTDLIERYDLAQFDQLGKEINTNSDLIAVKSDPSVKAELKENRVKPQVTSREINMLDNRAKYIVAKEGDTFYQIAKEFDMTIPQLHRYNDFPPTKDHLVQGDIVYLTPKRNRNSKKKHKVTLEESKELWQISQTYGIKLKSLMQINAISSPDVAMQKGEVVYLR